jgi:hypothetical protein
LLPIALLASPVIHTVRVDDTGARVAINVVDEVPALT